MTATTIGLYDADGGVIIESDQFDWTDIEYLFISTGYTSIGEWKVGCGGWKAPVKGEPVYVKKAIINLYSRNTYLPPLNSPNNYCNVIYGPNNIIRNIENRSIPHGAESQHLHTIPLRAEF